MTLNRETTVADVVSKRLGADKIFSKHQIDFCCGGGLSLEAACALKGVDMNTLIQEIEDVNAKIASTEEITKELLVKQIHEISPLAQTVASIHGFGQPELIGVSDSVEQLIEGYLSDELDRSEVDRLLATIRTYTNEFELPEDACISYTHLFQKLQKLEADWKSFKQITN